MKHNWNHSKYSDHAMVTIVVDFETIDKGYGLFKCPSELHHDTRAVPGGGPQGHGPPPQTAKISKQIGPHFGNHSTPSQYAALPNRKS